MMTVPFTQLLREISDNEVKLTGYNSKTDKKWAREFNVITNLTCHTQVAWDENGMPTYRANWDALLPPFADDQLRQNTFGNRPNRRCYRLSTEADMALWFNTEVSNVVLAAWNDHPATLQASEATPWDESGEKATVDSTYSLKLGSKTPLVIGEFKRNLINPDEWQDGTLRTSKSLSKELRGYAFKYKCPQVFCFDGETLLLLQFRAITHDQIRHKDCPVDCWVLPRQNGGDGCTLREGLYRLLVQGLRRCQGVHAVDGVRVSGYTPQYRELYSGLPVFALANGALSYEHPQNDGVEHRLDREVDVSDGSFYWRYNGQAYAENGEVVRDTHPLWGAPQS